MVCLESRNFPTFTPSLFGAQLDYADHLYHLPSHWRQLNFIPNTHHIIGPSRVVLSLHVTLLIDSILFLTKYYIKSPFLKRRQSLDPPFFPVREIMLAIIAIESFSRKIEPRSFELSLNILNTELVLPVSFFLVPYLR